MKLRWFLSGTVRQASDMMSHVRKLLNAQRDILSQPAIDAVNASLKKLDDAVNNKADNETLGKCMSELEKTAGKWIKPYPHAEWRENVEVMLVAIVVAMAIRTFFLQPFKIPTGSMQPTLFGVTGQDLRSQANFQMPGFLVRAFDFLAKGEVFHNIIAKDDGMIVEIPPVEHAMRFINIQKVVVQYHDGQTASIPIWFAPDDLNNFAKFSGVSVGSTFQKGQPIVRFSESTGDHLFVDRMTYNFRHPKRGEIIVFKTKGIPIVPVDLPPLPQDQFYIKRLVGLPGDTLTIGNDRHLSVNGVRLDASTPHFENVFGFDPNAPPQESHYSGYVLPQDPRSIMREQNDELHVPAKDYAVCGDNTMNSYDSRYWGPIPQKNVIGKNWFVYWPITDHFGWGQR